MSTLSQLGSKALQVLGVVAPTLATAWGGPLAGLAVQKLESVFGAGNVNDAALIGATPDQLTALKKVDDDFQAQMKALGVQEEQLAYQDTASARSREIAVKDHTPAILAYSVTVGFFSVLGYMMAHGIQVGNNTGGEAVLIMLGALGTAWAGIVSYYFGSSTGAQKGAEALASIAKQP